MSLLSKFLKRKSKHLISALYDFGFHWDKYLLSLVSRIIPETEACVETGTNVGTTVHYVSKTYPHLLVYSCEPDIQAFRMAQHNVADCPNVHLYKMKSPDFLYALHTEYPALKRSLNLYLLDAHGYEFEWPLKEEINFITTLLEHAVIIIDDAKIPDNPQFQYHTYNGQECNLDYIMEALTPGKRYHLCYPTYAERTSLHYPYPLVGYIVVGFGTQMIE